MKNSLTKRAVRGFFLGTVFCLAPLTPSFAQSTSFLPGAHVAGDELDLSAPCATVVLRVDAALKTGIALDESRGAAAQLQTTPDGASKLLGVSLKACTPGARLGLRLSPATVLSLHDSPRADVKITGPLAGLDAALSDATLDVAQAQSLSLALHGTAQARIGQLDRAAQIVLDGNARLTVEQAHVAALSAHLKDAASLEIASGDIETLALTAEGRATASVLAVSASAAVTVDGSATVTLGRVTGLLKKTGSGSLKRASSQAPAPASATPSPPRSPALPEKAPEKALEKRPEKMTVQAPAALPPPDSAAQGLTHPPVPSPTPPKIAAPKAKTTQNAPSPSRDPAPRDPAPRDPAPQSAPLQSAPAPAPPAQPAPVRADEERAVQNAGQAPVQGVTPK